MTNDEPLKCIDKFKINKPLGPDSSHPSIAKKLKCEIVNLLIKIYNCSFKSGWASSSLGDLKDSSSNPDEAFWVTLGHSLIISLYYTARQSAPLVRGGPSSPPAQETGHTVPPPLPVIVVMKWHNCNYFQRAASSTNFPKQLLRLPGGWGGDASSYPYPVGIGSEGGHGCSYCQSIHAPLWRLLSVVTKAEKTWAGGGKYLQHGCSAFSSRGGGAGSKKQLTIGAVERHLSPPPQGWKEHHPREAQPQSTKCGAGSCFSAPPA